MKKKRRIAGIAAMIAAAALATCSVAPVMMTASAEEVSTAGSITISNEATGHTYEAYQIFDGDLDSTGVLSNITWGSGVDTTKVVEEKNLLQAIRAISVGTPATTPFASCTDAAAVAKVLSDAADGKANTKDLEITKKFAAVVGDYLSNTKATSNTSYEISNLDNGYYLVKDQDNSLTGKDDAYTRYIVQVLGAGVTVTPKSSKPTVIKKVQENNSGNTITETGQAFAGEENYNVGTGYNDVADYSIGDAVPFKLYGTLPTQAEYDAYSAYYYEFEDTLGTEFDAPAGVTVKVISKNATDGTTTERTLTAEETAGNMFVDISGNNISVIFENVKLVAPNATDIITVEYTAVLNETAKIGLPGQVNEVGLKYSNNPNEKYEPNDTPDTPPESPKDKGETPKDRVIVFTYELDTTKIDGQTEAGLKDAVFQIYKEETVDGVTTRYYYVTPATGTTDRWVAGTSTTDEESGEVTWTPPTNVVNLTSGEDGKFDVKGIDEGTYYLEETQAPSGYNKLTDRIELVITATTVNGQQWDFGNEENGQGTTALTALKLSVDGGAATNALAPGQDDDFGVNGAVATNVENNKGSTLPSTGGIGTTLFYVVGGVLVAGAGVTLITKKRLGKED